MWHAALTMRNVNIIGLNVFIRKMNERKNPFCIRVTKKEPENYNVTMVRVPLYSVSIFSHLTA